MNGSIHQSWDTHRHWFRPRDHHSGTFQRRSNETNFGKPKSAFSTSRRHVWMVGSTGPFKGKSIQKTSHSRKNWLNPGMSSLDRSCHRKTLNFLQGPNSSWHRNLASCAKPQFCWCHFSSRFKSFQITGLGL